MGFFDKLAFWKKKDDLSLGGDFGKDLGLGKDAGLGDPFGAGLGGESFGNESDAFNKQGMGRDLGFGSDVGQQGFGAQGFGSFPKQSGGYDPGFNQPPGQPVPMQQPFGGMAHQQPQQAQVELYGKDLEVVSAKLDSIRYTLESINQRLANIERIAHGETEDKRRNW